MQHLFLTSSPCLFPPPAGTDAPFLIREDNGFLDRLRLSAGNSSTLLLIAADPANTSFNDELRTDFERGFRASGFSGIRAGMLDARNASALPALLSKTDFILLCGGHVPTQNRFFHLLHLASYLRAFEGTVLGISAGSMNAAETVYAQPEEPGEAVDPDYERFLPGLALTQLHILPHLNKVRDTVLDGMRLFEDITFPDSFRTPMLAIPDGSYIEEAEGHAVLYGEGHLVFRGTMRRICRDGESISL